MWEIASRRPPYEHATPTIITSVVPNGDREDILPDCPEGYMDLVQLCWAQDVVKRPEADEALVEIRRMRQSVLPDTIMQENSN